MRIGILTIGDELLIGQVLNTNATSIAKQCTNVGAQVVSQSTVADVPEHIVAELHRVASKVDVIITTGGLGPTHDDCTVESVASFVSKDLVQDAQWLQVLQQRFERLGRELTPRNAAQAMVPASAIVWHDSPGTAPGFMLPASSYAHSVDVIVLPGVPREMQQLMDLHVLPWIQRCIEESGEPITSYRTLITTGIPESTLADLIGSPDEFLQGGSLAFLPSQRGVRLRIGVSSSLAADRERRLDTIEQIIRSRAGKWMVGSSDVGLAEIIGRILIDKHQTLAVAESCTGGLLGGACTDVAGSSEWFLGGVISYSNDVKISMLGVPKSTLEQYGAVSEDVAQQMAEGVRTAIASTWGIGVTGVAGPGGGSAEKPVGTVWIAVAGPQGTVSRLHTFTTDRANNRERSVAAALFMLWEQLHDQDR